MGTGINHAGHVEAIRTSADYCDNNDVTDSDNDPDKWFANQSSRHVVPCRSELDLIRVLPCVIETPGASA